MDALDTAVAEVVAAALVVVAAAAVVEAAAEVAAAEVVAAAAAEEEPVPGMMLPWSSTAGTAAKLVVIPKTALKAMQVEHQ